MIVYCCVVLEDFSFYDGRLRLWVEGSIVSVMSSNWIRKCLVLKARHQFPTHCQSSMFSNAVPYALLTWPSVPGGTLFSLYYTGLIYHVTLAYLELKQLPGSCALKVPDIRIDDRARAEIRQGAKVNPTQRQTTYSLFAPSLRHRIRRKRQTVGVQNNLRRALDHFPVLSRVHVALLN